MREVTVIGAGPGGSVAAWILARAGWSVTLVEQHRYPRHKVCGECLSGAGAQVIEKLGVGLSRGIELREAVIHSMSGESIRLELLVPSLGISRYALDPLLLDAARHVGVVVEQPAKCERLIPPSHRKDPVYLRLRDVETNEARDVSSHHVILADGRAALDGDDPPATGDFGIKTHFEGIDGPRNAIELFACDGFYGGLAAVEDGHWNAAFSVPASTLRACRGSAGVFAQAVEANPVLRRRVAGARQVTPWLACPLPRFPVRQSWPARVIPVGNAAAALEPIGGEGMGLAIQSAAMAAEALRECDGLWTFSDASRLRARYTRLWRVRRAGCRAAGVVVSSPVLADALLPMLASGRAFAEAVMWLVGKPQVIARKGGQ